MSSCHDNMKSSCRNISRWGCVCVWQNRFSRLGLYRNVVSKKRSFGATLKSVHVYSLVITVIWVNLDVVCSMLALSLGHYNYFLPSYLSLVPVFSASFFLPRNLVFFLTSTNRIYWHSNTNRSSWSTRGRLSSSVMSRSWRSSSGNSKFNSSKTRREDKRVSRNYQFLPVCGEE